MGNDGSSVTISCGPFMFLSNHRSVKFVKLQKIVGRFVPSSFRVQGDILQRTKICRFLSGTFWM